MRDRLDLRKSHVVVLSLKSAGWGGRLGTQAVFLGCSLEAVPSTLTVGEGVQAAPLAGG